MILILTGSIFLTPERRSEEERVVGAEDKMLTGEGAPDDVR